MELQILRLASLELQTGLQTSRLANPELQTSSFRVEFTDNDFEVTAEAAATFDDNVVGFRVTDKTPNASLLPFTVKVEDWATLLAGVQATDSFTFDPNTGAVVPGSDGVPELKMYPGAASKKREAHHSR